jgi:hypothetical protein
VVDETGPTSAASWNSAAAARCMLLIDGRARRWEGSGLSYFCSTLLKVALVFVSMIALTDLRPCLGGELPHTQLASI